MPRRREVPKRDILPDPKFGSVDLSKFVNVLMASGKKSVAERIIYGAFSQIQTKSGKDPLEVFTLAVNNVKPVVEVKSRRVGGALIHGAIAVVVEAVAELLGAGRDRRVVVVAVLGGGHAVPVGVYGLTGVRAAGVTRRQRRVLWGDAVIFAGDGEEQQRARERRGAAREKAEHGAIQACRGGLSLPQNSGARREQTARVRGARPKPANTGNLLAASTN